MQPTFNLFKWISIRRLWKKCKCTGHRIWWNNYIARFRLNSFLYRWRAIRNFNLCLIFLENILSHLPDKNRMQNLKFRLKIPSMKHLKLRPTRRLLVKSRATLITEKKMLKYIIDSNLECFKCSNQFLLLFKISATSIECQTICVRILNAHFVL